MRIFSNGVIFNLMDISEFFDTNKKKMHKKKKAFL